MTCWRSLIPNERASCSADDTTRHPILILSSGPGSRTSVAKDLNGRKVEILHYVQDDWEAAFQDDLSCKSQTLGHNLINIRRDIINI